MGSRLLVITLAKLPDKLLEYVAHIHCRNLVGSHIRFFCAELSYDIVQNTIVGELCDFLVKIELFDNVNDVRGEMVEV